MRRGDRIAMLTKEGVQRILGPVDNALLAEIAATGADERELAEAHAWLTNDEALVNDFRPLPKGRVAELVDILNRRFGPDDEDDTL
ncbi:MULTISPECIES: hypothetical protein [Phyllobacteriaceae]|uniref:hypothetical protein n=1 Tax=Phyllobacteriaceae TaxID=69277 RepID=UPI002ACAF5B9|nr:hypothetical protein [Chelativorans sp. M5D2P16]MDZ5697806.1 hypothetical protein [Chelativorans sp. M5D2P16]